MRYAITEQAQGIYGSLLRIRRLLQATSLCPTVERGLLTGHWMKSAGSG